MNQQIIAISVVIYFLARLWWQNRKGEVSKAEYHFWAIFWLGAGALILFIRQLDQLVSDLGFSMTGITLLSDVAIIILFYFIFRLRIRLAKLEKDITKIVEKIALDK